MWQRFIAVDWGTTNRRVFVIENGSEVDSAQDGCGVRATDDFAAELAAIRSRFGDLPVLMAGMVGSSIGWHTVPYAPAPATLNDLAQGVYRHDPRTVIVPGISWREGDRADVMRGEEVQFFGAAAGPNAVLCQPGTHSKWAWMADGRIARFTTAMTGEVFALLRGDGILATHLQGVAADGPAFRAGVEEGARGDLLGSLFTIRSGILSGTLAEQDATSRASGLLIGAEVAPRLAEASDATVQVVAGPGLGGLYLSAIRLLGGQARHVETGAAFIAGISALSELLE